MTYGEAHRAELDSLELVNGEFRKTIFIDNKPAPMKHSDAVRYYNIKLFLHWVNDYKYAYKTTLKRKKEIVSALMFGNAQYYKKFKELK